MSNDNHDNKASQDDEAIKAIKKNLKSLRCKRTLKRKSARAEVSRVKKLHEPEPEFPEGIQPQVLLGVVQSQLAEIAHIN